MQLSYSRVDQFERCPYKYKLRYIDKLKPLFNCDASNALVLGTAVHTGIEKGAEAGIGEYVGAYPVLTDLMVNEIMKLDIVIPQVREMIPAGEFETKLDHPDFVGYIDLLVKVKDPVYGEDPAEWVDYFDGHGPKKPLIVTAEYDMYDFKYSKNKANYLKSPQLSIYKYFFELLHPGKRIRDLNYLLVPKTAIRQKKTEDLREFRQRIEGTLATMEPELVAVEYDPDAVVRFLLSAKRMLSAEDYPKNQTKLCDWCDYQTLCEKGSMIDMALPQVERVQVDEAKNMKGWIYGAPFSGKTTFLDSAPDPLNLNTDGNTKYVTMQRVLIRDEVTTKGRITERRYAWDVLKGYIEDLEKGSEFKTIIIDLVEDTREMCRVYSYDKLGIQHESDAGYGKGWDMIKTEYLSTMRRLLALDYNIFLVSHEDISKDITKAKGDKVTKIMPNIQEAIANKLAGMVDFVARAVVNDDGSRVLSFRANEVTFGGGRLNIADAEIPLEWDALEKVYDRARAVAKGGGRKDPAPAKRAGRKAAQQVAPAEEEPTDAVEPTADDTCEISAATPEVASKRIRKPPRAEAVEAEPTPTEEVDEAPAEEPVRRARKARTAEAAAVTEEVPEEESTPVRRSRRSRAAN